MREVGAVGGSVTAKEMKLAAYFLDMAADEFSNHGCNDMPPEALSASEFNILEAQQFAEDCKAWSGIVDPEYKPKFMGTMDSEAMHTLASKLRFESDRH